MSDQQEVSKYYDRLGKSYNDLRTRSTYLHGIGIMETDFVLKHIRPGAKVLEIGAGAGFFTKNIIKKASQATVIDVSTAMVDVLKNDLHANNLTVLKLGIEDLRTIPEYGTFDTVVCMRVLPHIRDLESSLLLIRNALCEQGNAIFDLWNDRSYLMLIRRLLRRQSPVLTKYYFLNEMEHQINKAGFRIDSSLGWGYPNLGVLSLDSIGYRFAPKYAYSVIFNVLAEEEQDE